jgi:hypothetical protein
MTNPSKSFRVEGLELGYSQQDALLRSRVRIHLFLNPNSAVPKFLTAETAGARLVILT